MFGHTTICRSIFPEVSLKSPGFPVANDRTVFLNLVYILGLFVHYIKTILHVNSINIFP